MKRTREVRWQLGYVMGTALLTIVIVLAVFSRMTVISHAETEGTVIAVSANIRQSADAGSEAVGSAMQGDKISIISQTTGADGYTWYRVYVNATTIGYIRADLVSASGEIPTEVPSTTNTVTPSTTAGSDVTAVQPVTATVMGDNVRVRSTGSTSGEIVTTLRSDVVLTIVGQCTDSDGYIWYQVQFSADSGDVTGFVRKDYVTVQGEILPVETAPVEEPANTEPEPVVNDTPTVTTPQVKVWETEYDNGVEEWYLVDNAVGERYRISQMFEVAEQNKSLYEDSQKTVKNQKILVVILVILVIALVVIATLLIFKIKDIKDSAYFEAVEQETLRKRQAMKSDRGSKGVMPTVGAENRSAGTKRPTVTQKPAGTAQGSQQGPAGASQKPSGGTPKPAGASQSQKPVAAQKPASQGAKPGTSPQTSRPAETAAKPKPKNFIADEDDEFEFEFLNWDGEDEN